MADVWEREIENPLMHGKLNMAQITITCALQYGSHLLGLEWRQGHPKLASWLDVVAKRPSVAATAPLASGSS
jgi:glutathione S-transferase